MAEGRRHLVAVDLLATVLNPRTEFEGYHALHCSLEQFALNSAESDALFHSL